MQEMTFDEKRRQIEESAARALSQAQDEENKRIDFENRCAAAQRLFEAEYVQPNFHAVATPILALIERLMQNRAGWGELRPEFVEAINTAKNAVEPCAKFFHSAFVDEWNEWLRQADHVFGRIGAARDQATRDSFAAEYGALNIKPGWFTTKTRKGSGESLNDHVALGQTLTRAELAPYMAQAATA